eukprot:scaffold92000_cov67-Phaeocystis_antarctica.AAC.3
MRRDAAASGPRAHGSVKNKACMAGQRRPSGPAHSPRATRPGTCGGGRALREASARQPAALPGRVRVQHHRYLQREQFGGGGGPGGQRRLPRHRHREHPAGVSRRLVTRLVRVSCMGVNY